MLTSWKMGKNFCTISSWHNSTMWWTSEPDDVFLWCPFQELHQTTKWKWQLLKTLFTVLQRKISEGLLLHFNCCHVDNLELFWKACFQFWMCTDLKSHCTYKGNYLQLLSTKGKKAQKHTMQWLKTCADPCAVWTCTFPCMLVCSTSGWDDRIGANSCEEYHPMFRAAGKVPRP